MTELIPKDFGTWCQQCFSKGIIGDKEFHSTHLRLPTGFSPQCWQELAGKISYCLHRSHLRETGVLLLAHWNRDFPNSFEHAEAMSLWRYFKSTVLISDLENLSQHMEESEQSLLIERLASSPILSKGIVLHGEPLELNHYSTPEETSCEVPHNPIQPCQGGYELSGIRRQREACVVILDMDALSPFNIRQLHGTILREIGPLLFSVAAANTPWPNNAVMPANFFYQHVPPGKNMADDYLIEYCQKLIRNDKRKFQIVVITADSDLSEIAKLCHKCGRKANLLYPKDPNGNDGCIREFKEADADIYLYNGEQV